MRVIVTGAGGFVGRAVVTALHAAGHETLAADQALPEGAPGLTGDLTTPEMIRSLFAEPCDAVVHLAAIPGGAAEADPDLGWQINVELPRRLAQAAAAHGPIRFVNASSIAVFGVPSVEPIDDDTPLAPTMLYGAHKAMAESWLATQSRRDTLSALSLRLSGVVARPGDGAGFKSSFASTMFHAIRAGQRFTLPVAPNATMWLVSQKCVAANLVHALTLAHDSLPANYALTLPALLVRVEDLVTAIASQVRRPAQVDYAPDPAVEAAFGSQPALLTPAADTLGFRHDGDLTSLVANAVEQSP